MQKKTAPIQAQRRLWWWLELAAILAFGLWLTRAWLDMDASMVPFGREFGLAIRNHAIWLNLRECGACVFWNGFARGGQPAFADLQGAVLHPFVILFTLLAGVLNGAKLTLAAAVISAGLAQWWLMRTLGQGRIARLFGAAMAMVGGHLVTRMELGVLAIVLSTAMANLAIAASVALVQKPSYRHAAALGASFALLALSGQGYLQIGFVVSIAPALLALLLTGDGLAQRLDARLGRLFGLAILLALALSAALLLPLARFAGNIGKPAEDVFKFTQPLGYVPLNLVIDTPDHYYHSDFLQPFPYLNLYANYVGWIVVLFAMVGLVWLSRQRPRLAWFFGSGVALAFVAASGWTFYILSWLLPFMDNVRFPSYIAALAVPLLLALSGYGIDAALSLRLPRLALIGVDEAKVMPTPRFFPVLMVLLLAFSVRQSWTFVGPFFSNTPIDPMTAQMQAMVKTDSIEWVSFPLGNHFWFINGHSLGLKFADPEIPQVWKGHELPPAAVVATRDAVDITSPNYLGTIGDVNIQRVPGVEYASVTTGDTSMPCPASGSGGAIDVLCPQGGQLLVYENQYAGWQAWVDGAKVDFVPGPWLLLDLPEGVHKIELRYQPWDVWLGLGTTLAGFAWGVWLAFFAKDQAEAEGDRAAASELATEPK